MVCIEGESPIEDIRIEAEQAAKKWPAAVAALGRVLQTMWEHEIAEASAEFEIDETTSLHIAVTLIENEAPEFDNPRFLDFGDN